MKIGIMQPYFFPYLGHFGLISAVDEWVVFDVTQYTPKTWMNRNRILHPNQGWQYITVPLTNSSISIKTHEARLLNRQAAKKSILGKLAHYKKKAPYYSQVTQLVEETFDRTEDDALVTLNIRGLSAVCEYLSMPFSYKIASKLDFDYPNDLGPGDWAPYIAERLGASEYINPASGRGLFKKSVFDSKGITLLFAEFEAFAYVPVGYAYEPHLSVLDAMMWASPEAIRVALKTNCKITA